MYPLIRPHNSATGCASVALVHRVSTVQGTLSSFEKSVMANSAAALVD